MRRWLWVSVLAVLPFQAVAQEDGVARVLAGLPEAQLKRLRADPDRFAAGAMALIFGYGKGGALRREEAEQADAIDRAERRARALAPFVQSDLDNDGAVARAEAEARAAVQGADARARLLAGFAAADGDADGVVSGAEMRAVAEAAATLRAGQGAERYMAFDLDGDGRLTVEEVQALRAALSAG
ncbi:hypothetical protein [Paragemmobacter straminiformis]|uniref:EF-hand domain-containing protein n=1 Tax=Paragemmobacter straminiformis TaxID=2045119 RepID=A0A842I3A8_9RHOB|nr:hypothetical protein [Gemmobacter straminiformis]MBC2833947.1 hypothetical protein [Gemmobacter straminiformis]